MERRYPDLDQPRGAPVTSQQPNAARIYDYELGGNHNTAADRAASAEIAAEIGDNGPFVARSNRAFLTRAVRWCVAQGVTSFLDLGSGIPTVGNVHEIAQGLDPAARVVYVDNEPVAVAASQALLAEHARAHIVAADLRRPDEVLGADAVQAMLAQRRPVALLLVAALHYVSAADDPARVLRAYTAALPPGSLLVVSQVSADEREAEAAAAEAWFASRTTTPLTLRSRDEIAELVTTCGWGLVEPGLVRPPLWRPDPADQPEMPPARSGSWAGVARLTNTGS